MALFRLHFVVDAFRGFFFPYNLREARLLDSTERHGWKGIEGMGGKHRGAKKHSLEYLVPLRAPSYIMEGVRFVKLLGTESS